MPRRRFLSSEIFDYGNLSKSDSQLLNTNAEIVCKNYLCIEMERFFLYCIKFLDKSKLGKKIEQISNKILVCF